VKTKLLLLTLLISAIAFAQQTYVPDDNFENYLETHDANGNTVPVGNPNSMGNGVANDNYVTTANISGVANLNVFSQNIADMTGIEDFTALQYLYCNENQLTALDVSQNTALQGLYCSENQLTALDVSGATALQDLYCNENQLTTLDVSQNTVLGHLSCGHNQLTTLDVSQNMVLEWLDCDENQLTALDVSGATALQNLYCYENQLTTLDVSGATALQELYCYENQLTTLDVSQNSALGFLFCVHNQLTTLNVKNGNNTNFYLDATNNPNLTCIFVDDAAYSTANWTNIDPTATFVETQADCDALAVTDFSFENNLSIYPNPTKNQVNIVIDRNSVYSIYTINGRLLKQGKLLQGINTLDIKNLSQGVYFIRLTDKNTEINRKLMIKH